MPLPPPPVALVSYRRLVTEALDRVPSHTPEWTNLNDADPGVTIVQLFAFIAETLSYRADLIPERNRRKFLQLLGVPLKPAQAARGLVAFSNPRGPLAVTPLAREIEVTAGRVPFRTVNALTVLPIDSRLYQKAKLDETREQEAAKLYSRLYGDVEQAGTRLDFYETRPFDPPVAGVTTVELDLANETTDGTLWIALLARPNETPAAARTVVANKVLTLAVLPAVGETSKNVPPRRALPAASAASLSFHLPRLVGSDIVYDALEARPSADLALHPGTVELRLPGADRLIWSEDDLDPLEPGIGDLPPSLAESEDGGRLITWVRVRAPEGAARLSGIWTNGAEVVQRAIVAAELLPPGTGEPDQRAVLAQTPVLPETVTVSINGEPWQRVDDLFTAGPEIPMAAPRRAGESTSSTPAPSSKAYTVDAESGEVRFGNGFQGMRPPRGATIVASYAYGGGRQGVVGIGEIKRGLFPEGIKVSNPAPTWGGSDAESVSDAEFRIPRWLRHRDRLVTPEDFTEITWATPGIDLGRVEILPLFHPSRGGASAEGTVTVLVVPASDAADPFNPEPDRLFLEAVCRHLEPRRLVTTELFLSGPEYRDLVVSAGIEVVPGQEQGPVLDLVENEIRRFLSPLAGGFDGRGWPLDKDVESGEVLAAVARVPGVARVVGLLLGNAAGDQIPGLSNAGLELPRVTRVGVTSGAPVPLTEVAGAIPAGAQPALRRLPVPVVPEEC